MNAVIYLRVSTIDQIKGSNPEGYSIPAQREACLRKAETLKADVIDEYIDKGESARTAQRPELQRLLKDLESRRDIDYIIVHKVDRLARSLHDDVIIGLAIQNAGAQLVSVSENIDETPSGRLLHGIMATIAEFYSRNLAAEALKGATEKAKQGGTPYRTPLGYINVIERHDEREVRTVRLDLERAPLIRWVFQKYATGDYSMDRLCTELAKRGMRTRRTGKAPIAPLRVNTLASMLSNRYYLGFVSYCGVEYRGRHQPLVSPAVFAAVQAIRETHSGKGMRSRIHSHYLKGLMWCGRCGQRLCLNLAKGNYLYFFCLSGQRGQKCGLPYLPIEAVEQAVANNYATMHLSELDREALKRRIKEELSNEAEIAKADLDQQHLRLKRLLAEKQRITQAYYDDVITPELLGEEQTRIQHELVEAQEILAAVQQYQQEAASQKKRALHLATTLDLREAYISASPLIRRYLNQAAFERLLLNDLVDESCRTRVGYGRSHDVRVVEPMLHSEIDIQRLTQAILALSVS